MAHLHQPILDGTGNKLTNPDAENFRLQTFLELLTNICEYDITRELISVDLLANYDLYVVLTRNEPYTISELDAIYESVESGCSLLLMSNHAPFHKFDTELASKFGVELIGGYWSGERGVFTTLTGEDFTSHPILTHYIFIKLDYPSTHHNLFTREIIFLGIELGNRFTCFRFYDF